MDRNERGRKKGGRKDVKERGKKGSKEKDKIFIFHGMGEETSQNC